MKLEEFPVGSQVKLNCESIFSDDLFTIIGQTEDGRIRATVMIFDRETEVELSPDILTPVSSKN